MEAKKIEDLDRAAAEFTADKLGDLRARIERLKKEAADYEKVLVNYRERTGVRVIYGYHYRAVVLKLTRKVTAWKKIAIDLGAKGRKIAANTKKVPVTSVRVNAHKK